MALTKVQDHVLAKQGGGDHPLPSQLKHRQSFGLMAITQAHEGLSLAVNAGERGCRRKLLGLRK
jgi:hypothetical protein